MSHSVLSIETSFPNGIVDDLVVTAGAERFVEDVRIRDGAHEQQIQMRAGAWPAACQQSCSVRYRFRLEEAAQALREDTLANVSGPVIIAPPATWLLHPRAAPSGDAGRLRFRIESASSGRFVTGVRPAPAGAATSFELPWSRLEEGSFSAFGELTLHQLRGATLALAQGLTIPDLALVDWVRREIAAVDAYLGRPATAPLMLLILSASGPNTRGVTLGGGGPSILLRLGRDVSSASLDRDWVLAHELLHTRFPQLAHKHTWFSEGLASFVEPLARVRAGLLSKQELWKDLVDGLPQGLPEPGAQGLDSDATWGSIYWGGSLYFLLAELEIREQTQGARSLEDALRAVVATGVNVEDQWPLARVLDVADAATGTRVMHELYERFALAPGTLDLAALWARLGIRRTEDGVSFDDTAPASKLRDAVTEH